MSPYIVGTLEGVREVYSMLLYEKFIDNDANHQIDKLLSNKNQDVSKNI